MRFDIVAPAIRGGDCGDGVIDFAGAAGERLDLDDRARDAASGEVYDVSYERNAAGGGMPSGVDEDEIKMYYSGYRFSETELIEGERACGLATLRLDGYTHLTLEDGQEQGSVTSILVDRGSATELFINASCADGSRIEVELIESESDGVLPGFSREECTPITTDSLGHRVGWGNRRLADVRNASFRIRFHLTSGGTSPELYSFGFGQAADK